MFVNYQVKNYYQNRKKNLFQINKKYVKQQQKESQSFKKLTSTLLKFK